MRKKCVLWAKPVLATLAIIIAVSVLSFSGTLSAQSSPDPLTLPRLAFNDFTYMGGFRLPNTSQGGDFSYGGSQMAFNPARNSLFVSSLHGKVAEVSIPAPVNTADRNRMSFASYLQPFSDPSEGRLADIGNGTVLAGLLVHRDRLYATGSIYYDANNTQVVSHFSHSTNLSEPSFRGMSQVWETGKAGYVGGYMANVPAQWQSLLGGPALTGQCCIPIVTRTSFGPAAFGFDPEGVAAGAALPASPLLYYTKEHATLGPWEGSSSMYGAATMMGGAAVVTGTRTALFIGRIGAGAYCYGYGVADPAVAGTTQPDGVMNCYDPGNAAKGTHGYPYRYQIWAYDLADFAAVKAGAKQPWEVVPYAAWPFDLPTPETTVQIGGIAYDAQRQLLYVAQSFADLDGCCERRPIIHTLKINAGSSTAPATPLPSSAMTVSATASVAPPQRLGASITWTAAATGGTSSYEYKWLASAGGVTTVLRNWSASPTFVWQPAVAASDMRIIVRARDAGKTDDTYDATAEYAFRITDMGDDSLQTSESARVASLALHSSLAAPQPRGSTIVWTATPTGGSGAQVYKWFVSSDGGGSWSTNGSWSASNQFTWTPAVASANYRVSAWVKRASNPSDEWEANSAQPFAISEPVTASTPVAGLALTTNLAAPQPAGSTIVWTATPTGGTGAKVYKWFTTENGVTWNAIGTWTASNQLAWTPAVANANYRVSAWVKRASNPSDEWEATSAQSFAITAPSIPVTSVALTTNLASPQPAASTIVWTATATGGTGSLVYKWFVSNNGGDSWSTSGSWTASNQFIWTPAVANANYRVSAWVKRASNPKDEWEATSAQPFAIAEPSFPVASVALTTNVPAPQELSSTIVWTATPSGGTGPLTYQWFVSADGATWNPVGSWASSNQFSWTPTDASANYRISVWVKRVSNPVNAAEAAAEQAFAIQSPITSVALTTNLPSPQPLSSSVEWTATPTGDTGDVLVYKWFVSSDDGVTWTAAGPWSASNRVTWTPVAVNPKYRVTVWVKHATNPSEYPEASAQRRFAIRK